MLAAEYQHGGGLRSHNSNISELSNVVYGAIVTQSHAGYSIPRYFRFGLSTICILLFDSSEALDTYKLTRFF